MIRSCSYCRLLLLLSTVILGHGALVTSKRSGAGAVNTRDFGHYLRPDENPRSRAGHGIEQRLPPSRLDRILQALDPPPNCTSIETNGRFADDETNPMHDNRLECFLWNLRIEIPKQSFEKDWVTITVQDMACTNFRLHGLRSNSSAVSLATGTITTSPTTVRLYDHDHALSTLRLSVNTISATCQGRYHLTGGLSGNVVATVEESLPPSPALELLVGVTGKGIPDRNQHNSSAQVQVPSIFQTLQCGTNLGCQAIRFSGSISAKMIQAFSGMIGGHITGALQEYICPSMTKIVDPLLTGYLKEFGDNIQKYLDEAVSLVDAGATKSDPSDSATDNNHQRNNTKHEVTDIVEFPAIHWTLSFLNEQLRYHLQTGWIPAPHSSSGDYRRMSQKCIDSFRGISGWIKSILGSRPNIRLPEYMQRFEFPLPGEIGVNGTIALKIPELIVEGLDQMDALQVLEPSSSESKDLQTKLLSQTGFSVVIPVKLEVYMPASHGDGFKREDVELSIAPTLKESFRLTFNITQIDATISSLIQVVDWESTTILQVINAIERVVESRNLRDLACLFRTLHNVQLSKDGSWIFHNILFDTIRLSRDKKDAPGGSLEFDLDTVINTVLDLFLEDYADMWTHLVRGFVRGPGSRSLNRFIDSWIKRHSISHEDEGVENSGGQCPTATGAPGQWVNFTKFEMLNTFNRYLDHPQAKNALNDFMECLSESLEDVINSYFVPHYPAVAPILRVDNPTSDPNLSLDASISGVLEDSVDLLKKSGTGFTILNSNNDNATKVTISGIEFRNWDSIQRLQVMKPSGDTSLSSSLVFGKETLVGGTRYDENTLLRLVSNSSHDLALSRKGPPEIELVVDVNGYEISGQLNLTLFGGLEANAEISIDFDLNRLENLTISHLFEEIRCAMLPVTQVRFLPGATLAFSENSGANITAVFGRRNFSLSTKDYPNILEISNDLLSWLEESSRSIVNYVFEALTAASSSKCPGVIVPIDAGHEKEHDGEVPIYWMYRDSTIVWLVLGFIVLMQGGLIFLFRPKSHNCTSLEAIQENDDREMDNGSHTTPLLSSYQELVSHPSSKPTGQNRVDHLMDSIGEHIIQNDEDESQGILEDQLVEDPKLSIFESDKTPEPINYLVPAMIVGTIVLFISSNLSVGASVDLSTQFDQRSIRIPALFQFSLGNTVSEMYQAGIYPLLILIVCFSGIWPYVKVRSTFQFRNLEFTFINLYLVSNISNAFEKLLLMLYSWVIPVTDPQRQERLLLKLDAMGKFSLVDIYVLILFVVAFRFHLGISDNLGIDIFVVPMFGFFSFVFATCLSLVLGHAALFYHRETMRHISEEGNNATNNSAKISSILNHGFKIRNANSHKRLSRISQGLVMFLLIMTMGLLVLGFLQESYTFEIGGLAGMMLGDGANRTSYSVLSLGAALPSSVEDPQNPSIVFLQGIFFFFTMATPIICLFLNIFLLVTPLTLEWQRCILVATEVANSWSAVEVFLLSILAALFQISTFASFMVGDKCDVINDLAKKIFDEIDTDTVCFTVDASVESNCWYLLVGATANFFAVSFCIGLAETAVDEKAEYSCIGRGISSTTDMSSNTTRVRQTLIEKLHEIPLIGCMLFISVPECAPIPEELNMPLEDELDGT